MFSVGVNGFGAEIWKSERAEANALVFDLLVGFVENKDKRLKPALSF